MKKIYELPQMKIIEYKSADRVNADLDTSAVIGDTFSGLYADDDIGSFK